METQRREIYLDNSATTRVCRAAAEAALFAMTEEYGNAASLHRKGWEAQKLLDRARKTLAGVLSCEAGEVYFTSGATESNNLALFGAAEAARRRGSRIVTTAVEHASVLGCIPELERRGFEVVQVPPREDGRFDPQDLCDAVDGRTVLVSCMMVNNETGTLLPVEEIGRAVKRQNPDVLFHVDAVQGFCRLPLRLKRSPIDLLSASGHKVYAPKGIGLLYLRRGVRLRPLFYGGGQQNGIRPGTDSVPLACAFAAAAEETAAAREEHLAHYRALRETLLAEMAQTPEAALNSAGECVPYIVNLSAAGIRSEIMLHYLEQSGIYVSSGSACSKGAGSHVLRAFGLPPARVDTALRLSFSPENTAEDIHRFAQMLREGLRTLAKQKR